MTDTLAAPVDDADLLADVSAWLDEHWDPDLTVAEWWQLVGRAGWTAPHFTREWGGLGYSRRSVVAVRAASIENGSDWVALLVKRLLKQANQTPWVFPESPLDTIREHVSVTPYYEEDMRKLADLIGVDKVLFGSDWPHGEALGNPLDFVKELHAFSDDEIRLVMRDNALALLGPSGAAA